jgi:hypothetical protein
MTYGSEKEKLQEVLKFLMLMTDEGLRFLYCAESVYQGFQRSTVMRSSYFFITVEDATLRGAMLALAKITDGHRNAISIHYLFNLLEQNARVLCSDNPGTLRESVAEHKAALARFEGLIDSVREYRDRVVAHLDRRHVTQAPEEVIAHPKVNLGELGECFRQVLEIVNYYVGYYDNEFSLGHLEPSISGDVDILVSWMNEHGKLGDWVRPPLF